MGRDFIIIGAGIIGSSIAREIKRKNLGNVLVLDKEDSSGKHASGRNSGVIHSGINQSPGTRKAEFCVKGSKMLRDYCKDHSVAMRECGTIVVAANKKEISQLMRLKYSGDESGVKDLRIVDSNELERIEPRARGLRALVSPTGAIVDSRGLLSRIVEESESLGAKYSFNTKVEGIKGNIVFTSEGALKTDLIINCAGLHADKIAHSENAGRKYRIIPFRGDYMRLPEETQVTSMIYPVPDLKYPFLGVHLTKTILEGVIAGPTATLSLFGKENYEGKKSIGGLSETVLSENFFLWGLRALTERSSRKQIAHNLKMSHSMGCFKKEIEKIYNGRINMEKITPYRPGIRAQVVDKSGRMVNDFLIESGENSIHILNAVSPGMTCSLAFAEYVAEKYL